MPGHHWAGVSLYKSKVAKFAVTQKFVDEFLNICFTFRKLGLDFEQKWLTGISVNLGSNKFVIVTNKPFYHKSIAGDSNLTPFNCKFITILS